MYILKVKGTEKIKDYIQIRDDKFTLIAYFMAHHKPNLHQWGLEENEKQLEKIIKEIPYGRILKLPF